MFRLIPLFILHEIFPTGFVGGTLFLSIIIASAYLIVAPLVLVRRKFGPHFMVVPWLIESILISLPFSGTDRAAILQAAFALFVAALVIHIRVKKRPEGRKFVDATLAVVGLYIGAVIAVMAVMASGR